MLLRVRLQNYTSFGDLQEASLEPITVIVGPNNSGKTNFCGSLTFSVGLGLISKGIGIAP